MSRPEPAPGADREPRRYREPLAVTLRRTAAIAATLGAVLAIALRARGMVAPGGWFALWGCNALAVFWFSFGGHWLEILYLNHLRHRLPAAAAVQHLARVALWFAGGSLLFAGMTATWTALSSEQLPPLPRWSGGVLFIAVEAVVHLVLALAGRPSFWNGRS